MAARPPVCGDLGRKGDGFVEIPSLADGISDACCVLVNPRRAGVRANFLLEGARTRHAGEMRTSAGEHRLLARVVLATLVALGLIGASAALAVPPGFSNQVVVPDITAATTLAFLPDGRMLVGELTGAIWVVQPGATQPDAVPFLQIDTSLLFGEQGLMDVLPDPGFAQNQRFYVFYTRGFPGQNNRNRVSRFTASGNGTVPGSETVLWQDDVNAEPEHHGGALAFGNDGKLYFTYGDQFQSATAQQLTSFRGKLLRINPDGTVPSDNPFFDGAGPNKDAIWAYGLRNPFRISIDAVTGRIYIADVGGNDPGTAREEINLGAAGANYGWPLCEGPCGLPGVTSPIHSYPHLGRDASITGGFVYRGTQFPLEYRGSYFFADYVQNWIKRLTFDAGGNVTGVVNFEPARRLGRRAVRRSGQARAGTRRLALLRRHRLQRRARPERSRNPPHPVHAQQPAAGGRRRREPAVGTRPAPRLVLERRIDSIRRACRSPTAGPSATGRRRPWRIRRTATRRRARTSRA